MEDMKDTKRGKSTLKGKEMPEGRQTEGHTQKEKCGGASPFMHLQESIYLSYCYSIPKKFKMKGRKGRKEERKKKSESSISTSLATYPHTSPLSLCFYFSKKENTTLTTLPFLYL